MSSCRESLLQFYEYISIYPKENDLKNITTPQYFEHKKNIIPFHLEEPLIHYTKADNELIKRYNNYIHACSPIHYRLFGIGNQKERFELHDKRGSLSIELKTNVLLQNEIH